MQTHKYTYTYTHTHREDEYYSPPLLLLFLTYYLTHLTFSYACLLHSPLWKSQGTNWRPAELNVPSAGSQMVVAEGKGKESVDGTERRRVPEPWCDRAVWGGGGGCWLALHSDNLLRLRGLKAVHTPWAEMVWPFLSLWMCMDEFWPTWNINPWSKREEWEGNH